MALLSACSAPAGPAPAASVLSSPRAESAAPTPGAAGFVANGSARQNLPAFRAVTEHVWASASRGEGRAYIDALVKAGFEKRAMQVTEDRSTVGNAAESIQFSVRWKDGQCLIGQVGPATGDPVTVVMGGLPGGKCLIGKTRPIDW